MIERCRAQNNSRELEVKIDDGLCFEEFGRLVILLLEDLLYRTSHIDQPVNRLDLLKEKLSPRNQAHFERLQKILSSIGKLASSGALAEIVLLQGSTVLLAQNATHILVEAARWHDNTIRHDDALKLSKLNLFRAVTSADDFLSQSNGSKTSNSFLFLRVISEKEHETSIEGFEQRPSLPSSRAKSRTVFRLYQNETSNSLENKQNQILEEGKQKSTGIWLQLVPNLPSVSIVS